MGSDKRLQATGALVTRKAAKGYKSAFLRQLVTLTCNLKKCFVSIYLSFLRLQVTSKRENSHIIKTAQYRPIMGAVTQYVQKSAALKQPVTCDQCFFWWSK